ncbi:MAG TPA: hypothetical protein VK587_02380 [bacterium]|nr:hypothetical protein [bacterium]
MGMRSLAGMCALALAVLWAGGGVERTSAASMSSAMAGPPPLSIVSPTPQSQVRNPVSVVLETTGDMAQLTMGASMNNMGSLSGMGPSVHLHIVVDGHVLMPAASQLVSAGQDRYRYTFGHLSSGPHTIKVFWADNKTHNTVGPVHTVTCTVVG